MDHDAGLGDFLEPGLALEDDQRAVPVGGEDGRSPRDFSRDMLGDPLLRRRDEPGDGAHPADAFERPAELRLEDHHEGEETDDGARLEDLRDEPQLEPLGHAVQREQDAHAEHEPNGPGPPDQTEEPIDQEGRDADVDQRARANLVEDRLQIREHPRQSVASGSRRLRSLYLRRTVSAAAGRRGSGPQPDRRFGRGSDDRGHRAD